MTVETSVPPTRAIWFCVRCDGEKCDRASEPRMNPVDALGVARTAGWELISEGEDYDKCPSCVASENPGDDSKVPDCSDLSDLNATTHSATRDPQHTDCLECGEQCALPGCPVGPNRHGY